MRYRVRGIRRHDIINVEDHIHLMEVPDSEKQFHANVFRIDTL